MIPITTIPETAYDPTKFFVQRKQSRLARYLFQLTRGSSIALTILYIVAWAALKPLLETTSERRLEVLEHFRHKLRDCYLNLIGRVSHIPIVAIHKNGRAYADAIVQTEETEEPNEDKLKQGQLVSRLEQLSELLREASSYSTAEIQNFRTASFALKELQNRVDLVFFGSPFCYREVDRRKVNLATEARDEVRTIKGLYMSGQV